MKPPLLFNLFMFAYCELCEKCRYYIYSVNEIQIA